MDPKIIPVPRDLSEYPKGNVGKFIFERISSFDSNSVAFVEVQTGTTCTYGALCSYSVNMAASLRNLGIVKNDHLCIISENSHKFYVAALAGLYLAAPLHLLNPGYTTYEMKQFIMMSKPKVVFCSNSTLPKIIDLKNECTFIQYLIALDDVDASNGVLLYEDLIRPVCYNFRFEEVKIPEEQVAYIANSSGTTGLPKGVMISQENLLFNIKQRDAGTLFAYSPKSTILFIFPLYHCLGFGFCYCNLSQGDQMLLMNQFVPEIYLGTIEKHKLNKLYIVPTLGNFLASSSLPDKYDLSSVKEINSAAGALRETTYNKLLKKFNLKIRQIYGLTEVATSVFMPGLSDHQKPGSCGKVLPGNSVKIVDPKTGKSLGADQPGEICIKTVSMIGYLNDPENTRKAYDSDGYLKTGDIGYFDDDLDFYIVDRIKDMIKYKSFQVAPLEIEEILLKHPGVKDVAVVGKPDERYGELAVAFIVKKENVEVAEEELVQFVEQFVCVEKRLHGGVQFVRKMPRSPIGKILKKDLRKLLEEK